MRTHSAKLTRSWRGCGSRPCRFTSSSRRSSKGGGMGRRLHRALSRRRHPPSLKLHRCQRNRNGTSASTTTTTTSCPSGTSPTCVPSCTGGSSRPGVSSHPGVSRFPSSADRSGGAPHPAGATGSPEPTPPRQRIPAKEQEHCAPVYQDEEPETSYHNVRMWRGNSFTRMKTSTEATSTK